MILKATDQAVTNNATPQDDTDLVYALAANEDVEFEGFIICNMAGNNGTDCRVTFTVPTGATIRWLASHQIDGVATPVTFAAVTASGTTIFADGSSGQTTTLRVRGVVRNGATEGNLQFQFANNQAGGGRITTVVAGSFLKVGSF